MLKSMRKSKKSLFLPHFCVPEDAPGAITLNVVWMERKFDAYKLSRCVCPCILTITVSELQRNICKKSAFYHTPCIRRPRWGGFRRNIGTPFGTEN